MNKINRLKLLDALEKTKPGVASKEFIEQSTFFVFTAGMIITYNDEISVAHPMKEIEGLEGAIKAEEVYKLLKKMNDEEIEIEVIGNEFRIRGKNVEAGLMLESEIRLPIIHNAEPKNWKPLPDDFLPALKFVVFSCSQDMSKPVLTCINVTPSYAEASDGFRVTRYNFSDSLPISNFLIPESTVSHIIKYDVVDINVEEEWAHFQTREGTILSCRIFNDAFPDIDSMKILEVEGPELTLPKSLSQVIERVSVFIDKQKQSLEIPDMSVYIADKTFRARSQGEYGWVEEKVRINYNGDPIAFSTNPIFLKDIVTLTRKCTVGNNKMKFEGDNWVHVLALSEGKGE